MWYVYSKKPRVFRIEIMRRDFTEENIYCYGEEELNNKFNEFSNNRDMTILNINVVEVMEIDYEE